jgi:hypothetical protein
MSQPLSVNIITKLSYVFFRGVWLKGRELDESRAVALNKLTRQSPLLLPFKAREERMGG